MGTLYNNKKYFDKAEKILNERNINILNILDENTHFNGIGWDINNNYFKIYFTFDNKDKLPYKFKKLISEDKGKDYLNSGIISITYLNNIEYEEKVYLYKKDSLNAKLLTNLRGVINQIYCKYSEYWYNKVNKNEKKIIKIYNKYGYRIDTVNYLDENNYTLYFT